MLAAEFRVREAYLTIIQLLARISRNRREGTEVGRFNGKEVEAELLRIV